MINSIDYNNYIYFFIFTGFWKPQNPFHDNYNLLMHAKIYSAIAVLLANQYSMSVDDVEQVIGGLVYGLVQKDDLALIKVCLKDAQSLEGQLQTAITDIVKGDITDIIAGVEILGQVLQELPADLSDCQGMQPDIDRIEKWAAIFNDPTTLVKTIATNVFSNYADIKAEISQTEADISASQWYTTGSDVADILVLSLGPVPESQW